MKTQSEGSEEKRLIIKMIISAWETQNNRINKLLETLSDEQRAALSRLLTSRDFITLFRGGAGTGKSFVLKRLADGLTANGHSVTVLAPQRQQVVDLRKDGVTPAFARPATIRPWPTN